MTSITVLWLVVEASGFLEALNLIQAYAIKKRTKTVIAVITCSHETRLYHPSFLRLIFENLIANLLVH